MAQIKLTSGRTHFMVNGFAVCGTPKRGGGVIGTASARLFANAAKDTATCCAKCAQIVARIRRT